LLVIRNLISVVMTSSGKITKMTTRVLQQVGNPKNHDSGL